MLAAMYRCWVAGCFVFVGAVVACGGSHSSPTDGNAGDGSVPATGWASAAIANAHACGIQGSGELDCWGGNTMGELGLGGFTEADAPTRVGTAAWKAISVESQFSCGIQADESLWCWGFPSGGLGVKPPDGVRFVDTPIEVGGTWSAVATAYGYACGIQSSGTLWCWGTVPWGAPFSIVPVELTSASWSSLAVGDYHACGIQSDGSLWCWGNDATGALGDGQTTSQRMPARVGTDTWGQVSVSRGSTCGITSTGHLRCWGDNRHGELAMATTTAQATVPGPVMIAGQDPDDWVSVALGDNHVCGVRSDHSLWCWGANEHGQLGQPTATINATPTSVPGTWISVIAADDETCAIASDHTMWCTGADGSGQLGDGGTSKRSPTQVAGTWSAPALIETTLCALDADGAPRCVGDGIAGLLGNGGSADEPDSRDFVPVLASSTPWLALSGGDTTACGIAGDRSLWCWGGRSLGVPNSGSSGTPLHVGTDTWMQVSTGLHSCAIDSSNAMYCWGDAPWGEDGCGAVTGAPVRVGTDATWTVVATGHAHSCGINATGTYCWGGNYWAQLGTGSRNSQVTCTPTAVAGSNTFVSLAAGDDHTCALDAVGHAYCWGYNNDGQVGVGTDTYVVSPTMIPNMTWLQIAGGYQFSCGVATDHSLWCWGDNSRGQLGDGTYDPHMTPVRVGTDTDWQEVEAGTWFACATKTDHSLWCWGANDHAQLGDGTGWRDQLVRVQ